MGRINRGKKTEKLSKIKIEDILSLPKLKSRYKEISFFLSNKKEYKIIEDKNKNIINEITKNNKRIF